MPHSPAWLQQFMKEENLPSFFGSIAMKYYLPLARSILYWARNSPTTLVVGINGAQGTGKSTMSKVLAIALEQEYQLKTAILSIDDIYLTQQERQDLSKDVHPLLKTRGVPGTHDVNMGITLIEKLKNQQPVRLPAFDKAIDDRLPPHEWTEISSPVDIILFEGWCIGVEPQPEHTLAEPCNQLEQQEDPDGFWRNYANQQLAGPYRRLFGLIDRLVMLKAPDFECVYQWRSDQENKLRLRHANDPSKSSIMDDKQIKRFLMHYERISRWMFSEMPPRADCVIELNHDHAIAGASFAN